MEFKDQAIYHTSQSVKGHEMESDIICLLYESDDNQFIYFWVDIYSGWNYKEETTFLLCWYTSFQVPMLITSFHSSSETYV